MNIQIYGKSKCFDTKKAERYFKERGIKTQLIDLPRFGMSPGEFKSVKNAVGGLAALIGERSQSDVALLLRYLAGDAEREQKLLENPALLKTPVVRNGKQATVGYCPEVWKTWE